MLLALLVFSVNASIFVFYVLKWSILYLIRACLNLRNDKETTSKLETFEIEEIKTSTSKFNPLKLNILDDQNEETLTIKNE